MSEPTSHSPAAASMTAETGTFGGSNIGRACRQGGDVMPCPLRVAARTVSREVSPVGRSASADFTAVRSTNEGTPRCSGMGRV